MLDCNLVPGVSILGSIRQKPLILPERFLCAIFLDHGGWVGMVVKDRKGGIRLGKPGKRLMDGAQNRKGGMSVYSPPAQIGLGRDWQIKKLLSFICCLWWGIVG